MPHEKTLIDVLDAFLSKYRYDADQQYTVKQSESPLTEIDDYNDNLIQIDDFKTNFKTLYKYYTSQCFLALDFEYNLAEYKRLATQGNPRGVIEVARRDPTIIYTPSFARVRQAILQRLRETNYTDKEAEALLKQIHNLERGKQAKRGQKLKITVDPLPLRKNISKVFYEIVNLKNKIKCGRATRRRLLYKYEDSSWEHMKRMEREYYDKKWHDETPEEHRERTSRPIEDINAEVEKGLIETLCRDIVQAAYQITAHKFNADIETIRKKTPGQSALLRKALKKSPQMKKGVLYELYKQSRELEEKRMKK